MSTLRVCTASGSRPPEISDIFLGRKSVDRELVNLTMNPFVLLQITFVGLLGLTLRGKGNAFMDIAMQLFGIMSYYNNNALIVLLHYNPLMNTISV